MAWAIDPEHSTWLDLSYSVVDVAMDRPPLAPWGSLYRAYPLVSVQYCSVCVICSLVPSLSPHVRKVIRKNCACIEERALGRGYNI